MNRHPILHRPILVIVALVALAVVLSLIPAAVLAQTRPAGLGLTHWAILCSPELQSAALEDRLLEPLNKLPDIQLLDRQQLHQATKELALDQIFAAEQAEARLKLGRLLPADGLLILRRQEDGSIQLLIAECRQGIRLHRQSFSNEKDLLGEIAPLVQSVQKRFPQGLKQVLAIPPFLSRNLVQDYDALQSRYAQLLAGRLMLEEGVAVIESEEARAIAREAAISGDAMKHPLVPLIVEGEFRMERPPGRDQPHAFLKLKLTSGQQSRMIESGAIKLANVPEWIATDLAKQVVAQAHDQPPMSLDSLVQALGHQAAEFARVGAWEHSTALREAALMLKGDAADQRIAIIEDYAKLCTARLADPLVRMNAQERMKPTMKARTDAFVAGFAHLEYLVRNRQVDVDQAVTLTKRLSPLLVIGGHTPWGQWTYPTVLAQARRAEEARLRFMLDVFPQALSLAHPPATQPSDEHDRLNHWQQTMLRPFRFRADRSYVTKQDLALFHTVITEIVPDGLELRTDLLPNGRELSKDEEDAATPEDYQQFLGTLEKGNHKAASIMARYVVLSRFMFAGKRHTPEELRQQLTAMQDLLEECRRLPYPDGSLVARDDEPLVHGLIMYGKSLERDLDPPKITRLPASSRPASVTELTTGPIQFRPVGPIRVKRLDGSIIPFEDLLGTFKAPIARVMMGPLEILPCGPGLDIYWSSNVILCMREPGLLEEVLSTKETAFDSVAWDGRHLWVGQQKNGILILDARGKLVGKVTEEQGLPPSDWTLVVRPLDAGRALAAGCFGPQKRGWCAIVERADSGAVSVRVFHEGVDAEIELPGPSLRHHVRDDDPRTVFCPRWIRVYQPKDPSASPAALVSRGLLRPLLIDLKTLAVSVYPHELPSDSSFIGPLYFSPDGAILGNEWGVSGQRGRAEIRLIAPAGRTSDDGGSFRRIPVLNPPAVQTGNLSMNEPDKARFLPGGMPTMLRVFDGGDGYLYLCNSGQWHRIDTHTWTADRLTPPTLPMPFANPLFIGRSTHYGVVAYSAGKLFRLTIDASVLPRAGEPVKP